MVKYFKKILCVVLIIFIILMAIRNTYFENINEYFEIKKKIAIKSKNMVKKISKNSNKKKSKNIGKKNENKNLGSNKIQKSYLNKNMLIKKKNALDNIVGISNYNGAPINEDLSILF